MTHPACRLHEVGARGGLTDERRSFREKLRMVAAERFAQDDENAVIAQDRRNNQGLWTGS